jgi:hypothetical protein
MCSFYLGPKINNNLFISGYQFGRLDRYNVLRTRCPFVLGLDILCAADCGKCCVSYPVPRKLAGPLRSPLTLAACVGSLALRRKRSICQNMTLSLHPSRSTGHDLLCVQFVTSQSKIYAQL